MVVRQAYIIVGCASVSISMNSIIYILINAIII